jgi:SET and MYND domain-containing protein 4
MKNNEVAEGFLDKASDFFTAKQYKEALVSFNQCLRFAANDSQVSAQAFAGRAKVYFEVNQFEMCSDNIQRAISGCVLEEKCKSYKKLQKECDESLENIFLSSKDIKSFFKLSQPVNKKIPFVSECLEVLEDDVYGRFIATNKDLKPGDVVVLEEPFYKVLDPQLRNARCAICLQQNMLNLIPCTKCSDGE